MCIYVYKREQIIKFANLPPRAYRGSNWYHPDKQTTKFTVWKH